MAPTAHIHHGRCLIPPSPELRERMKNELDRISREADLIGPLLRLGQPDRPGLNDGLILPGDHFPIGTPLERVRAEAAERAPLRGPVRVIVVLVDFEDRQMDGDHDRQHFEDLFFSRGVLPNGSVREYFAEVTHGLVDIIGEVVGPFRMPRTLHAYANGQSGTGPAAPNARTMARDAATAANPIVNFGPYDNDGNGFVDAFIVIHAGAGAERTGRGDDIWSHKWVLSGGDFNADGTRIFAYLTVPEDARIGVCCHELGHLLFGWPDLYDTDGSAEGLGNWCLMAGGSWNGGGDVPAHPSAWCKADQGWVEVINQAENGMASIADVKDGHTVHRLWKHGDTGDEYFLVENRQRRLYDRELPGDGLLVFHVDDKVATNSDERHPKVALLQADGADDLGHGNNRGDAGDPFPGTANNTELTHKTSPSSQAYGGGNTSVSITEIGASGPVMSARLAVRPVVVARPRRRPLFFDFWRWLRLAEQRGGLAGLSIDDGQILALRRMIEGRLGQPEQPARALTDRTSELWARSVEERLEAIEATLHLLRETQLGPVAAGVPPQEEEPGI
jgi:immune inhibitor A